MSRSQELPEKVFTVDDANAMLPLVRAIVRDLVELARDVADRRERLAAIRGGRNATDSRDVYGQELAHIEERLEQDSEVLRGYITELFELGVEPKSATEGLVDFPAVMGGRQVYLCWKLGEPEVQYWHDLEAGFQGRKPLRPARVPGSAAGQRP
jgi:hypothetical protein